MSRLACVFLRPAGLALALAGFLPGPARAEVATPPASTGVLTLEAALQQALTAHETAEIAAARLQQARAARQEAIGSLLPRLDLTATWARRPLLTREVGGVEVPIRNEQSQTLAAGADMLLWSLPSLATIRSAGRGVEAARVESGELQRGLAIELAQTYLTTLSAEQLVAAARRRTAVAEAREDEARRRFERGLAARGEWTRLSLERASAELALAEAEQARAAARVALGVLLAAPTEQALTTPTGLLVEDPFAVQVRSEGHPRLEALSLRRDAAASAARAPIYSFLPTLGLAGTWSQTNDPGFAGRAEDWNVQAVARWRLFDGGVRVAQRRREAARLGELDAELRWRQRELDGRLETARVELRTARVALTRSERQLELAVQWAEEVRLRSENGLASGIEQADALASLHEAEADRVRRELLVRLAELAWLDARGQWPAGLRP